MIDRSLNYGRMVICEFLKDAMPYNSVLDIGAGTGIDLLSAREQNVDARLFAMEGYPPNIDKLKALGINVYHSDVEKSNYPFVHESVDIVISNQVLEHTKDVFWILHEISRVLTVGGKLILGVPNLASMHNRLLLLAGRQPSPIKTNSAHVRGFTKPDVLTFLDECFPGGYKLKKFGGSNFYPFPPLISKPLAKMFPTFAWGIFFLFEKTKTYHNSFIEYPVVNQLETNFYLGKPDVGC